MITYLLRKRYHNNNHSSVLAPHNGGKAAGIDTE